MGVQMEPQNYTVGHKSHTKIGHRTMLNTLWSTPSPIQILNVQYRSSSKDQLSSINTISCQEENNTPISQHRKSLLKLETGKQKILQNPIGKI